jgi:hypothetical protein
MVARRARRVGLYPASAASSRNEIEDAKPAELTAGSNVLLNAVLDRVNPGR